MKKITINHLINVVLLFYIISLYLLTYREGFNLVSNGLAACLIGLIWLDVLGMKRKFVFNTFLFIQLIFIMICLISVLYAINPATSMARSKTLIIIYVLMVSLVNYLDTFEKVERLLRYYVYSGSLASLYILVNSDFSEFSRMGGSLGNVNALGMIIGISFIIGIYFIFEKGKFWYLPFALINISVVLLTGSRKALLFVGIALFVAMYSKSRGGLASKLKFFLKIAVIATVVLFLIFEVPIFYEILGERVEDMFEYAFADGEADASLETRTGMIDLGFESFLERPLQGYGIDNFRFIRNEDSGGYGTYSHNNFIELLTGIGLFGVIIYYLTNLIVVFELIKCSRKMLKPLCYLMISIVVGYMFMSVGLVYYYDKHVSILLAVGSVIYRFSVLDALRETAEIET